LRILLKNKDDIPNWHSEITSRTTEQQIRLQTARDYYLYKETTCAYKEK
jgi:hypothetical protein